MLQEPKLMKQRSLKELIESAVTIEALDMKQDWEQSIKTKHGRILIVDDQIFNIEFLKCQLEMIPELESRCDYAENGVTAVQLVKASIEKCNKGDNSALYKLVLLDYSMPMMDGPATSEAIFKLFENLPVQKPYVVCLTAFTENAFKEKAMASGMSEFVSKPISNEHLLLLVK